jgi:hypothetical protein
VGKKGGGVLTKEKKHVKRQKRDEKILMKFFIFSRFFNFRGCRLQTSLLFSTTTTTTNKNARNATHLHDLLGIPDDDFEEKSFGEQQRDEADSF